MAKPSDVGTRVAELRELAGLSARELSILAGLSPSMVGHIEAGRVQQPGADTVSQLAEVMGASLSYLIKGEGKAPSKGKCAAAVSTARTRRNGSDPAPEAA
jgi:transcriptional regulator with XRE-family HTH domain